MKKFFLLYILFVLSAAVLWGCGSASSNPNADVIGTLTPVPPDFANLANPFGADAAIAGAAVFKNNCESCHGRQGHGDGPAGTALAPAPKNLALLQTLVGDDYLFWRISVGKDGTAMIAWKDVLTEEQIWQLVAFIRTLKQ
jgi:mono/diheme cytochrome c family protein